MTRKKSDISTSTPYLGIPEHKLSLERSVREREPVTIDTWGVGGGKDHIFLLTRIAEVKIGLFDEGNTGTEKNARVSSLHVVTHSRHHFKAGTEDFKPGLETFDDMYAFIRENSVFGAVTPGHFLNWDSRLCLRPRRDTDDLGLRKKDAQDRIRKEWKMLDKDLPGYLRNMDEESLDRLYDSLVDLRVLITESIK